MKIASILSVAFLIMFPVVGLAQTVTAPQTASSTPTTVNPNTTYYCGDGKCDTSMGETTAICEKDCPEPTPLRWDTCGDKICQPTESKSSCSVDCGYPWVCGDGICGGTETDWNCPHDCPKSTTVPASASTPTTVAPSPYIKCGVSATKFCNECGAGVYKNVFVKCSDGSEVTLGVASSCKPIDLWKQYAKEACATHCSSGGWGNWSDVTSAPIVCVEGDGNIPTPLPPISIKPVETTKATPVCYISDSLMQKYSQLIIELQKSESDKVRTELINKEMAELKQQIATQQNQCVRSAPQPTPKVVPWSAPTPAPQPTPTSQPIVIKNIPVAVSINHCNEVAQWETKIAYYKKISGLSNDELKKSGFSREDISKILQELSLGIENVRGQCAGRENTPIMPRITTITGSASIAETTKPVVVESGAEINAYYKSRIEKAVSVKGEEKQIQELKTLRDEIDGLISNLIKSRKELEVSELNTLVKEVKVSRGEIKADDISVKTTEKKLLVNVGDRPVSVEPTKSQVLIRDKGLEVNTEAVMIKENVLSVGGVDVMMSASEVTEKLGLAPKTIELKEENSKAVYDMKIEERRKLFGFIPINSQRIITADAENGNALSENLPWYNFMTTK